MESNDLGGSLPTEIGLLTRLDGLELGEDSLDGSIPSELGLLTALTFFDLQQNNLLGGTTVPTELGNLSVLGVFTVALNGHVGVFPTEIGSIQTLSKLLKTTGALLEINCQILTVS